VLDRTLNVDPPLRVGNIRRRSRDEIGVATLGLPVLRAVTLTVPIVGTVVLTKLSGDNNNN
jgi:hypothetical protein